MTNKAEQNILDLYERYQSKRTPMAKGVSQIATESITSSEVDDMSETEKKVLSLYHSFQSSRVPNREQVISNVMSVAKAQISQQPAEEMQVSKDTKFSDTKLSDTNSAEAGKFWSWLQSLIGFDSFGGWQTAAVLSVAIVVTTLVTILYPEHDKSASGMVAGIPGLLVEHRQQVAQSIQPNLNPQFGFSASYEDYQVAFRSGVLLVELPLLVRTEQQSKLQRVVLEASLILKQSSDIKLSQALDQLLSKLKLTSDKDSQLAQVNEFIELVQRRYSSQQLLPLFEFGRWLEVSLLTTQLDGIDNKELLHQLLLQGRPIAKQTGAHLKNDPAVRALIEDLQGIKTDIGSASDGVNSLRDKLLQIKAAML